MIVGGTGPRMLRIAATLGDAANVPSARPALDEHVATLRRHSETVRITVLDLPTDRHATARTPGRGSSGCAAGPPPRRTPSGRTPAPPPTSATAGAGWPSSAWTPSSSASPTSRDRTTSSGCALRLRYFSSVLDSPRTRRATISCWICWVPSKMSRILESRAHFSSSSVSL